MCMPEIKNAFANVKRCSNERIEELFPKGVPEFAQEIYEEELEFISRSGYANEFDFVRRFSNESRKINEVCDFYGKLNRSFVFHLLRRTPISPLPLHYYCTNCGCYELIDDFDEFAENPKKKCPDCGTAYRADGMNFDVHSCWGEDGKNRIDFTAYVSEDFVPVIKNYLQKLYPDQEILEIADNELEGCAGFAVLPKDKSIFDYNGWNSAIINHKFYLDADKSFFNNSKVPFFSMNVNDDCTEYAYFKKHN